MCYPPNMQIVCNIIAPFPDFGAPENETSDMVVYITSSCTCVVKVPFQGGRGGGVCCDSGER